DLLLPEARDRSRLQPGRAALGVAPPWFERSGCPPLLPSGRSDGVGLVHVDVEVNRDRGPSARVRFLVDSGAAYSVLPHDVWRKLGLKRKRTLDFSLADGTTIRRRLSECRFRYQGLDAVSPVVLGEPGDAALLGTVT